MRLAAAYALARLNPDPNTKAMALLVVGKLEARQGHSAVAREALKGAALLGAHQPGLLMAVGDVLASPALNERESARAVFQAALDVSGSEELREQIRERIAGLERAPRAE